MQCKILISIVYLPEDFVPWHSMFLKYGVLVAVISLFNEYRLHAPCLLSYASQASLPFLLKRPFFVFIFLKPDQ